MGALAPLVTGVHAIRYPRAAALVHDMQSKYSRVLAAEVDLLIQRHGDAFWAEAEHLVCLAEAVGNAPLDALLEYTVAYLREQARYVATDRYTQTNFETARREVYDNPDVMLRFYLPGLMLTHAFWPIHFDVHAFFRREFLARIPDGGVGTEIGYGHGLYLLDVLTARPQTRTESYDLSPFSQEYAGRLLRAGGIVAERYDLRLGDVRERLPLRDATCDWLIFAEVLEHIPDPAFALRELARCLKPGRPLFATTVIDSNALDHLYRFESVEQVHGLLAGSGFRVRAEQVLRAQDYDPQGRDPSIIVVFVCTLARS